MSARPKLDCSSRRIALFPLVLLATVLLVATAWNQTHVAQSDMPGCSSTSESADREYEPAVLSAQRRQLFRWDFSKVDRFHYRYAKVTVITEAEYVPTREADGGRTITCSDGIMTIDSQGDNKANLVYRDVETRIEEQNSRGRVLGEPLQVTSPPVTIKGFGEDGSIGNGISSHGLSLNPLMAMPSGPLSVGEQASVDRSYSVEEGGIGHTVDDETRITLLRYVRFNGHVCAELESETVVRQGEAHAGEEPDGVFLTAISGKSRYLFDIERRLVVHGDSAVEVSLCVYKRMGKTIESQRKERMRTTVTTNSQISFSLIEGGS